MKDSANALFVGVFQFMMVSTLAGSIVIPSLSMTYVEFGLKKLQLVSTKEEFVVTQTVND